MPKRLLIAHQGALGDFIVTFPVLRGLRQYFSRIDAICRTTFGQLANHLGIVDRYYPVDAARFASLYTNRIDQKVIELILSYDRVLLFSFSDTLERAFQNIKGDHVFRIPPWPNSTRKEHVTAFLTNNLIDSNLLSSSEKEQFTASVFDNRPLPATGLTTGSNVVISPGAGSIKKRWPLSNFLKLAVRLQEKGLQPEFLLGPAEQDIKQTAWVQGEGGIPVIEPESLTDLASILKKTDGYIGNDSAVSHLAAFLGVPVVAIFGPSDPDRWRPVGQRVAVVRSALDCSPCFGREKNDCDHLKCLNEITIDWILESFDRLFQS